MKRDSDGKTKNELSKDMFGRPLEAIGEWKIEGDLWIFTHSDFEPGTKVAAFDMGQHFLVQSGYGNIAHIRQFTQATGLLATKTLDGTLITTKSGRVFPTDESDWKLLNDKVSSRLKKLHADGFKVVIFTNQKGIKVGKVDKNRFKKKIVNIVGLIGVPMQVFVSIGDGEFRKPMIGMWKALEAKVNDTVDTKESIYVGDAAGRHKTKTRPKKDHSTADRFFAMNVGVRFETPEQFFLGQTIEEPWGPPEFEPVKLCDDPPALLCPTDTVLPAEKTEIIVLVGFPGSGKSTFAKFLANKHDYVVANRDSLGTWQKCLEFARGFLKQGKSVVIDNTNPTREARSRYTTLAKQQEVDCRCFEMKCSYAQALHNVRFRSLTNPKEKEVTSLVLRMHSSKLEKPEMSEGYSSIVGVNFVPQFENDDHRKLYTMFLTEG